MKRSSRFLVALIGFGILALVVNARADDAASPVAVGKPQAPTEDLRDWQWYVEIAQPKAGEGNTFDFLVPPVIFDKANESLSDLRLRDAKDQEIPYALFVRRAKTIQKALPIKLFNRTTEPDHSVSVSLEVEGEARPHNEIVLATSGQDYRRRVKVESSDDGQTWNVLLESELIFFKVGTQLVDVHRFQYPENRRRYLRVTVHPDPGKKDDKPEIKAVTVNESVEEKGEQVTLPAQLGIREATRVDGVNASTWPITFDNLRVPVETLLVQVNDPVFDRTYRLERATEDQTPALEKWASPFTFVTSGVWNRRGDGAEGRLEVRFPEIFTRQLRLAVVDANNPPLTITGIQYQAPARQVIFARSPEIEWPIRVYFGNSAAKDPAYDFQNTVSPQMKPPPIRLTIAAHQAERNPQYQAPPLPWSEQHPALVYGVLGLASVVLFVLMALLARQALARTPQPAEQTT